MPSVGVVDPSPNPGDAPQTQGRPRYGDQDVYGRKRAVMPTVVQSYRSRPSYQKWWREGLAEQEQIRQFLTDSDGRYWTRTSDFYDVNVALYQLS